MRGVIICRDRSPPAANFLHYIFQATVTPCRGSGVPMRLRARGHPCRPLTRGAGLMSLARSIVNRSSGQYRKNKPMSYHHQIPRQQRQPRFQPPELSSSRQLRERERFEPYGPGPARHEYGARREYDDEDSSRRNHHQGPSQHWQSRFEPPEPGTSRPRRERGSFEPYGHPPGPFKREYDDEEGRRDRGCGDQRKRSRGMTTT